MSFLVDECFREESEKHKWTFVKKYVATTVYQPAKATLYLHHFIWKLSGRPLPEAPLTIDHINRDPKDNRLENLRIATPVLQALNTVHPKRKHDLPRGVCRTGGPYRPYQAQISVNKKRFSIGFFATPEEASSAYEAKRDELLAIEVEKSLALSSPESHQ